ncbi:MAG: porin family protein [Xanthobacteraceae bacterium]|nr:porin family protein [Xanthobacteraceae bacterium]
MKKFLLTGVALAALACGPALAADLPVRRGMPVKAPEPVSYGYNWSGFYIGAHAGGGWSEKCFTFAGATDGCHDADGWLAGGQVGFNVQSGQFVFGVEFSGSWTDINGSHASLTGPAGDTYHTDLNSLLMLTGRVGMTFDRMLIYVTGGGAWARDEFRYTTGGVAATTNQNRTGWTVGAGIEYGLAPNWSIAAQYNYVDLGDKDVTFGPPASFTARAEQDIHLATVRLNYRFGGWGGPVVARY